MNRGRGGHRGGGRGGRYYSGYRGPPARSVQRYVVVRHNPVGGYSDDTSSAHETGSSEIGRRNSEIALVDDVTKKFSGMSATDNPHGHNPEPHGIGNISPNAENSRLVQNVPEAEDQTPKPLELPSVVDSGYNTDFPSSSTHSELNASTTQMIHSHHNPSYLNCNPLLDETQKKKEPPQTVGSEFQDGKLPHEVQNRTNASEGTSGKDEHENSDFLRKGFSLDICEERNSKVIRLKSSLLDKNRAVRNEMKRRTQGTNIQVIRPGMILLKSYLPLMDQVKLIKACRELGQGAGGFYQPGYRDGATLHLKMMCLGKNWDPETSSYGDVRPIDEAIPPPIPDEFQRLVKEALQECHDYLDKHSKERNARNVLPSMSPNVCIINFYTKTGRLGLHQDKDESKESLRKGLPVVSFSLGDSAKFLFGDERDIEKAMEVVLGSGDVLIFGGESRHIFHGVSTILPETAPKPLLEETGLRPGRLNLTFREY